jgi:hypothetical protein
MGAVFMFPAPTQHDACCPLCRRAVAVHRVTGRGFQCVQDVVVGRDQMTAARRARLAQLHTRVLKVHPFGIDVEELHRP